MPEIAPTLPSVGLRERRRLRVVAELEETALRLFSARGFDSVTVDDIVAEAEVSRRTFFRYFSSKEDVLLLDHSRRLTELRENLAARPDDEPPLAALRHALLAMACGFEEEERERFLRRFQMICSTPSLQARSLGHQRMWEQAVTEMMADRMKADPAVDLRPGIIAGTALAAVRVALGMWLAGGGKADLRSLVAEALDLLDGGLQQAAGRSLPKPQRRAKASGHVRL
ncbi:MAG: TetR family transcriptional regulator [Acidimicrobiia bacterium]